MERIEEFIKKTAAMLLAALVWTAKNLIDILFGRLKQYQVSKGISRQTVVGGRKYRINKKGMLTIYSVFDKVATFTDFDTIIEI